MNEKIYTYITNVGRVYYKIRWGNKSENTWLTIGSTRQRSVINMCFDLGLNISSCLMTTSNRIEEKRKNSAKKQTSNKLFPPGPHQAKLISLLKCTFSTIWEIIIKSIPVGHIVKINTLRLQQQFVIYGLRSFRILTPQQASYFHLIKKRKTIKKDFGLIRLTTEEFMYSESLISLNDVNRRFHEEFQTQTHAHECEKSLY